ncbi:MAG: Sua5/YciO/YrdC/YwlC family protein, partial [Cyanobacteria bacterium J149]
VYALEVKNLKISGIASTVVKWTGSDWQILRQGQISIDN